MLEALNPSLLCRNNLNQTFHTDDPLHRRGAECNEAGVGSGTVIQLVLNLPLKYGVHCYPPGYDSY